VFANPSAQARTRISVSPVISKNTKAIRVAFNF
jgi:hypothetical protein